VYHYLSPATPGEVLLLLGFVYNDICLQLCLQPWLQHCGKTVAAIIMKLAALTGIGYWSRSLNSPGGSTLQWGVSEHLLF